MTVWAFSDSIPLMSLASYIEADEDNSGEIGVEELLLVMQDRLVTGLFLMSSLCSSEGTTGENPFVNLAYAEDIMRELDRR